MKVKVVRKVVTYVEEVIELDPKEYCELRADMTPLKTAMLGNVDIEVKTFEPLTVEDKEEFENFFNNRG